MRKITSQRYIDAIIRVITYIEDNLSITIDAEELAAVSRLSPQHFLRVFTACTGEKTADYIRKRCLTRAAEKLLQSSAAIIDIAYDSGYDSQEAFSRAFKKQFNTTPGKYRKNNKILTINRIDVLSKEKISQAVSEMIVSDSIIRNKAKVTREKSLRERKIN